RVASKNASQPGQPFPLGGTAKAIETTISFQQGLLDEVGRIELGTQPAFDLRSGDDGHVVAANGKKAIQSRPVAAAGPGQQAVDGIAAALVHLFALDSTLSVV